MSAVLALSGSPSPVSRTASAAQATLALLEACGHTVDHIAVRELPAAELLNGGTETSPLPRHTPAWPTPPTGWPTRSIPHPHLVGTSETAHRRTPAEATSSGTAGTRLVRFTCQPFRIMNSWATATG